MKGHYKPEDFRREKRRVPEGLLLAFRTLVMVVVLATGGTWLLMWATSEISPKPQPPIPAVSYETKRLLLDERRNVLLERIAKALETKPEATTNALRTPLPGVAEQLGVSAATRKLVAELESGGDE